MTCTAAHETATAFEVAPSEVGKTADLPELRIVECQIGGIETMAASSACEALGLRVKHCG